jgi:hypothetical protein
MLRFDAAVDYSACNTFSVSVSSMMWDIDGGNATTATRLTNEFAFTFHADTPLPQVYPVTYSEVRTCVFHSLYE